ncbi:MAG TPA: hypothetical protein VGD98_02020 [Ktedonobacteraceae bacterium]
MPKPPTHALVWVSESASYELWTQGYWEFSFQASDEAQWLAWLETHLAFSFRGQGGHMNMLKEIRQRGRGYWYAYRGLEKRAIKRYLGPTARVTLALLEEVAGKLGHELATTGAHTQDSAPGAEISQEAPKRTRPEDASLIPLPLKFRPLACASNSWSAPGFYKCWKTA